MALRVRVFRLFFGCRLDREAVRAPFGCLFKPSLFFFRFGHYRRYCYPLACSVDGDKSQIGRGGMLDVTGQ